MSAILIVEDDALTRGKIERAIRNIDTGIKILKAKEGKEALQIAESMEIDIFVIDIGLPDMNGIELAKEIRKKYPYNSIIIESSLGNDQYQVKVHDQIENLAYLKKPYSDEKLIAKLNNALNMLQKSNDEKLKIEQSNFTRLIMVDEILYIEKVKGEKKVIITLYNSDRKCLVKEKYNRLTLTTLLNMLGNKRSLLRCHKSYIINPKMIEKLNYANDTITLKHTEEEIPIGKTYKSALAILV